MESGYRALLSVIPRSYKIMRTVPRGAERGRRLRTLSRRTSLLIAELRRMVYGTNGSN